MMKGLDVLEMIFDEGERERESNHENTFFRKGEIQAIIYVLIQYINGLFV